jgi:polar amino acid transport system permease protein
MSGAFDWAGVLSGESLGWLIAGLLTTACLTLAGAAAASLVGVVLFALRTGPLAPARGLAWGVIAAIRNTPLLVQLLFWYFAGYGLLPAALRDWLNGEHAWAVLPGGISFLAPEFLAAAWGLGLFFGVFMAEELRAGLAAVPPGQTEAARSQGLSEAQTTFRVLLPQALANAWQPLVGQYLNLMKFSSLASAIGLAELTYQVQQVESVSAHAFEAIAAGTGLYLLLGLGLGRLLGAVGPRPPSRRRTAEAGHGA